jgi:hypothetical protein
MPTPEHVKAEFIKILNSIYSPALLMQFSVWGQAGKLRNRQAGTRILILKNAGKANIDAV